MEIAADSLVRKASAVISKPSNLEHVHKKLEDLKVLKRSPDLLNNVKIGQGQLWLIMKHILFYHIWGLWPFRSSDPKTI